MRSLWFFSFLKLYVIYIKYNLETVGFRLKYPNCVRTSRLQTGWSREELAKQVGVTVQSIGLIESGKVSPSTHVSLRLGQALNMTVEQLFSVGTETVDGTLISEADARAEKQRVFMSRIAGQIVARPVSATDLHTVCVPANGVTVSPVNHQSQHRWTFQRLQPQIPLDSTLFISGCDMGLGLIAGYMRNKSSAHQGIWFNAPNAKAMRDLQDGITHVAAVHSPSPDHETVIETPYGPCHRYIFAEAELGWIVQKGNPLQFKDASHLQARRMRLINRGAGAGSRDMLDKELRKFNLTSDMIDGYEKIADGHVAVADAVAKGFADVGVGHSSAAALFGLDFIPLQSEVCTLLIPEQHMAMDAVQIFLDALHSDVFRQELFYTGPYNIAKTGSRIS